MTVPCTSCGEILDPADDRCPQCGTLAPPRPGASVFAHEAEEPRWSDEPTVVAPVEEPTAVADPLAIPIREPSVSRPPSEPPAGIPRPVLIALGVVAAMALVAVLAAQLLGTDDPGGEVASDRGAPTTGPDPEPVDDPEADGVAADDATTTSSAPSSTTSTTASTSTSTAPSTTAAAPPTTRPRTTSTTSPPPTAAPGSVPTLPSSFRGGWVAQLSSVPAAAGTAAIEAAYDRIRSEVPGALAARSDEWPSLSNGYWVFVETGFGSEDDVRSFCARVERAGDACLPRQLTDRR